MNWKFWKREAPRYRHIHLWRQAGPKSDLGGGYYEALSRCEKCGKYAYVFYGRIDQHPSSSPQYRETKATNITAFMRQL